MAERNNRDQFEAYLVEIIDRTAEPELLSLIANDDELRDARHQAEEVVHLLARAADDYSAPPNPVVEPTSPKCTSSGTTTAANVSADPPADAPAKLAEGSATLTGASSDRRYTPVWIALSIAAVLGVAILLWSPASKNGWRKSTLSGSVRGTVTKIEGSSDASRVEICAGDKGACRIADSGTRVDPGMLLRTNSRARARLELDSGATIVLDRATGIVLAQTGGSQLVLNSGTIVVDMDENKQGALAVESPWGRAELERAKCAISVEATQVLLEVTRGRARLFDKAGHDQVLYAGETGRTRPGQDISVTYSRSVGDAVANAELVDDRELDDGELLRGLGEMRAKKPGDASERDNAVRLTRHHVKVHIVGVMAKTEIDETFANDTNDVLEGIFRFPLPADAQIERLALEVDGRLVEGAFTDRERASAIWRGSIVQAAPQLRAQIRDEIIWVPGPWKDPALLEWQRGNRFELRIYPIPRKGSRRIVLSYTQVVPNASGSRRYSYPLPRQTAELRGVEDFSVELELRGHDASRPPSVLGYEGKLATASSDVASFTLVERHFLPRGDLIVDYELPQGQKDLVAWAYHSAKTTEEPYVAMLVRPRLPSAHELPSRTYAFVVDTSRSMVGESLRRATALTVRMIRELSNDDGVVVLACDSECRRWPDGRLNGGRVAAEAAERWLEAQSAEGASDLAGAIEAASAALVQGSHTDRHIVYVGDGTPTVGPTRPATIVSEARRHLASAELSVTAVAVGADSDLESLRALARGGRGVVVPYVPGTTVTRASYAALAATFGTRLVDARIELPSGVVGVAPDRLGTITAGDELLVVGRLSNTEVRGEAVLRGRINDRDFEQRYAIDLTAVAGDGNAFVPRLYAAARICDLERRGDGGAKLEALELSQRFSVASRYTSLLVLESQAMFEAFGLDNRRKSETWTGELEASATSSAAVEAEEEASSEAYSAHESPTIAKAPVMRRGLAASAPAAAPKSAGASALAAGESSDGLSAQRKASIAVDEAPENAWRPLPSTPPRRMIPMRRIWERKGEVIAGKSQPSTASYDKLVAAEREVTQNPDRRASIKKLFDLYVKSSDLAKAHALAEQWSQRDPLDVEALVARADLAARRGDRSTAIRILGSVVDVRPSDVGAQQRLSRLYRWQGQSELACRFALALAEFRPNDEKALADALRCLNETNHSELSAELRGTVADRVLPAIERLLAQPRAVDRLSGDLRLTANWQGSDAVDVDLSLIDPDAHRVSWLGAPTRAVISATNVTSQREESLALRGGKPGEYLLEVSRGSGAGRAQGTVTIHVAGTEREIPFTLEGDRVILGVVKIVTVPRLVPLAPQTAFRIGE